MGTANKTEVEITSKHEGAKERRNIKMKTANRVKIDGKSNGD